MLIRLGNAALNKTGQDSLSLALAETLFHKEVLNLQEEDTALFFQSLFDRRNPSLFFSACL